MRPNPKEVAALLSSCIKYDIKNNKFQVEKEKVTAELAFNLGFNEELINQCIDNPKMNAVTPLSQYDYMRTFTDGYNQALQSKESKEIIKRIQSLEQLKIDNTSSLEQFKIDNKSSPNDFKKNIEDKLQSAHKKIEDNLQSAHNKLKENVNKILTTTSRVELFRIPTTGSKARANFQKVLDGLAAQEPAKKTSDFNKEFYDSPFEAYQSEYLANIQSKEDASLRKRLADDLLSVKTSSTKESDKSTNTEMAKDTNYEGSVRSGTRREIKKLTPKEYEDLLVERRTTTQEMINNTTVGLEMANSHSNPTALQKEAADIANSAFKAVAQQNTMGTSNQVRSKSSRAI